MTHSIACPKKASEHTDAAKRVADTYALHRLAVPLECVGHWFAVALNDGTSDGVLYPTKQECIRHQKHNEQWYAFVRMMPGTMTVCDAEIFLATHRKMYDAGLRMQDPDDRNGGRDIIPRVNQEDQFSQIMSILSGGRNPQRNMRYRGK